MTQLDGKVALVTGAGAGIGRASALALARAGAAVCVADINGEDAEETAERKSPAGAAKRNIGELRCDKSGSEVSALVAAAVDAFGRLDAAVNNAGHRRLL